MSEEENLKAAIALLEADANREFEKTKRNIDIIGILGLSAFVVFSIVLVIGALTLLLLVNS